jgi:phosphatidate cytidylyltransferase
LLTALILVPIVAAGVWFLPTPWLGMLLALAVIAATEEWARLAGLGSCGTHVGLLAAVVLGLVGMAWVLRSGHSPVPLLVLAGLWWLWAAQRVVRIARIAPVQGPDRRVAVTAPLVLVPAWTGLVWLHAQVHGPALVLFVLVLIWVADSAAYFSGRLWGRRKLAPVVSPGKTLEGVFGAMAGALVMGAGLAWASGAAPGPAAALLLLCLVTAAVSIVGDLYESLLKRTRGVKDSGSLLPGHGGLLDRIDSLTAAAPVFALGLHLIGGLS